MTCNLTYVDNLGISFLLKASPNGYPDTMEQETSSQLNPEPGDSSASSCEQHNSSMEVSDCLMFLTNSMPK